MQYRCGAAIECSLVAAAGCDDAMKVTEAKEALIPRPLELVSY
jgi:hypothetical protein